MLLVAQRVHGIGKGVNVYQYRHAPAPAPWSAMAAFSAPVELVRWKVEVPVPGGLVLSYLDLAVEEGTDHVEICRVLLELDELLETLAGFPSSYDLGYAAMRLRMRPNLVAAWKAEAKDLMRHMMLP